MLLRASRFAFTTVLLLACRVGLADQPPLLNIDSGTLTAGATSFGAQDFRLDAIQRGVTASGASRVSSPFEWALNADPSAVDEVGSRYFGQIDLATGGVNYADTQLVLPAYAPWPIGISYNSSQTGGYVGGGPQGKNWFQDSQPSITSPSSGIIRLFYAANAFVEYKQVESTNFYAGTNGAGGVISQETAIFEPTESVQVFHLRDQAGTDIVFFGFESQLNASGANGQLWKYTVCKGTTSGAEAVAYVGNKDKPLTAANNGYSNGHIVAAWDSADRKFTYTYANVGSADRLTSVAATKTVGSTTTTIATVEYAYYGTGTGTVGSSTTNNGVAGDLAMVRITLPTSFPAEGSASAIPAADVDFSGTVEKEDEDRFQAAYAAYSSDKADYDPRADLDRDGDIDGDDESSFYLSFNQFNGLSGNWKLSQGDGLIAGKDPIGLDNRFGWRGYWYDPHLQKYHVRNRVYDPREGRWMQNDPLGFGAGDQDLYRYCNGEYSTGYDPEGLDGTYYSTASYTFTVPGFTPEPPPCDNGPHEFGDRNAGNRVDGWDRAATFAAGVADGISLGVTSDLRNEWGINGRVDTQSGWYSAGVGIGVTLDAMILGGPAGMSYMSTFGGSMVSGAGIGIVSDYVTQQSQIAAGVRSELSAGELAASGFFGAAGGAVGYGAGRFVIAPLIRAGGRLLSAEAGQIGASRVAGAAAEAAGAEGGSCVGALEDSTGVDFAHRLAARDAAAEGLSQVEQNKIAGDAFRDEVAQLFRNAGRTVRTEVYKWTPLGKRFIDVEVGDGVRVFGGVETKFGASPYTRMQRLKDAWLLYFRDYRVDVLRGPLP